jgi:hypothetical protein
MDTTWKHFVKTRDGLPEADKKNFAIRRMRKKWPYTSILRFDGQINALHYLHSKYTEETPIYVCKGADRALFETYRAEFDYCFESGDES